MSSVLIEFEPGVVRDMRIDGGPDTRLVAGVDYTTANAIFLSRSVDGREFRLDGTGSITNLDDHEYFGLAGGSARLSSRKVEPGDKCFLYAKRAVSNSEEWVWAKVKIHGGPLDGYACLAIKHDTAEAVVVSLRGME